MSAISRLTSRHEWVYLRDLLSELVRRDLKLRYRRSVLGYTWSLLNPLLQLAVLSFVFRFVFNYRLPHYLPFLFCGLIAWNWFQASLSAAAGAIVDNRELVRRPGFPIAVLPIVPALTHFIHFLLSLPVLLVLLAVERIPLGAAALALPLLFALQFLLIVCLSYFLATFQVPLRDTQYLLGIALMLGFYLTPVFYASSQVPAAYQQVYHLNPLAVLIDAYRQVLLDGQWPNLGGLLLLAAGMLLALWGGYRVFKRASYRFAEEL